jgi:hypothetical protein
VLFVLARHDNNARFGDGVAVTQVGLRIVTDRRTVRNYDPLVDDRTLDLDVPSYGDVFKQNRLFHQAVAVDLAERPENGASDGTAAGDAAGADV